MAFAGIILMRPLTPDRFPITSSGERQDISSARTSRNGLKSTKLNSLNQIDWGFIEMVEVSLRNMVSHKQQVDSYKRKNYVPKPKETKEDKFVVECLTCNLDRCMLEYRASCTKLKQIERAAKVW
jgi:hypothetical protein